MIGVGWGGELPISHFQLFERTLDLFISNPVSVVVLLFIFPRVDFVDPMVLED